MSAISHIENVFQISSDEDDPASDARPQLPTLSQKAAGKRKLEEPQGEKVIWDADSDDALPVKAKRRKPGRRSIKGAPSKGKGSNRGGPSAEPQDDYDVAGVPEYLKERRQAFDKNYDILHEGGLLLPPDYNGVHLSHGFNRGGERPVFEDSTGVRPCRPYEDIELTYSAGVIPAPIAQYLRDYQIEGVKFLHRLFVYQKGGILGDDMGLGKTVQVAAFLTAAFGKTGCAIDAKRMRAIRHEQGRWYPRVLIVCPGSLTENWRNELNRWGWWTVELFHGSGTVKEDVLGSAKAGMLEIMITTYHTYKNHSRAINMIRWDAVVADECHALKRASAETTRAMDEVNALCRIGLTGTAVQNNYTELWTLLNWTNPGHFGTMAEWERSIAKPLRIGQSHDATFYQLKVSRSTAKKLVENLLPRFFLRRMKSLIADQLPKKSDRVVFCPLTDEQRDAYKNFTQMPQTQLLLTLTDPCGCGSGKKKGWCCYKRLPNGKSWQSVIFPSVITLQKLANHLTLLVPADGDLPDKRERELETLKACCPETWEHLYKNREAIINLANPEFCGKWKVLKKLLKFWHDNGDKVLIFSHSVRLLRILQHLFHNSSYSMTYLDGSLSYPDRQAAVDNFNSDPTQFVFLISTKAGGVGLNITAANKVVIVDPHWNPAYDLQAQDRAYRIGQRRAVDVFRLVSAGTIEEIVYARQIYKQQQANIGYTASSERRYFKGVQEDEGRKGEIFGLHNLFTYREDELVIRDIVNKTNIAEAKAGSGLHLANVDMDEAAQDETLQHVKQETPDAAFSAEDGGMSQLAALVTNQLDGEGGGSKRRKSNSPQKGKGDGDAIQAILASAGVEYSHDNSEVIGTSKVEQRLSRAAELAGNGPNSGAGGAGGDDTLLLEGNSALFASDNDDDDDGLAPQPGASARINYQYNPPEDVMRRQFCSMAREFGFGSATEFALVVEGWTQEQRRNCLETFYKIREGKLLAAQNVEAEGELDVDALLAAPSGARPEEGEDVKSRAQMQDVKDEEKKRILPKTGNGKEARLDAHSMDRNAAKRESDSENRIKVEEIKSEQVPVKPEHSSANEVKMETGNGQRSSRRSSSIFIYDSGDDDDEL